MPNTSSTGVNSAKSLDFNAREEKVLTFLGKCIEVPRRRCKLLSTLRLVTSNLGTRQRLGTHDLGQFNSTLSQTAEISDSAFNNAVLPSKTTMSEVTDDLYISGYEFASNLSELQRHRITHILNMSYEYDDAFPNEFTYMHIPAKDTLTERLGPWFHDIAAFVAEAKKSNGTTLVHCQLGISRSFALLASVIINEELCVSSAFNLLKGAAPDVEPNPTFLRELRALEREIHGECSLEELTVMDQCKTPTPFHWKESIAIILASAAAADTRTTNIRRNWIASSQNLIVPK